MQIKGKLCEDLGLKYPIFQGGMAYISTAELAAAVSNAGGLGLICSSGLTAAQVAEEIRRCQQLLEPGRAFGVNLMLQSPEIAQIIDFVTTAKVPVVTTGAGDPTPHMPKLLAAGIKVIPVVPNVRAAKKAEAAGAYAVVAEGTESGGHIGEMTTLALVPQVLRAVNIPVLAAGGIADGRSLAAMLVLGAVGVQLGTIFLVADECPVSDLYKQRIIDAVDTDTIVTGRGTSHVVRALKTPMPLRYAELEKQPNTTEAQLEALAERGLLKAKQGDLEGGCFMAGQISGLITKRASCAEIMQEIMAEAEAALSGK
ncbi:MAG: enoyl-[acyl-carrier-protein] reductase FabK [Peptococcaceae bacterium]|jgi:enoyl-[acyl-carrier protein] reductase II|nr:enoyl-[acyl-carrier-protein] reductase FabK [Peptococcaceae bacterium]